MLEGENSQAPDLTGEGRRNQQAKGLGKEKKSRRVGHCPSSLPSRFTDKEFAVAPTLEGVEHLPSNSVLPCKEAGPAFKKGRPLSACLVVAELSAESEPRQELVGESGRKLPHSLFGAGAHTVCIVEELCP